MKASLYTAIIAITVLVSCHKSVYNDSGAGNWQLVHEYSSVGLSYRELTPSKDSSVLLSLYANNSYTSRLNNKIISQGSYTIVTDTSYYNKQVLQLNNFSRTGIFGLSNIQEYGVNNQVIAVFNGLFMTISSDTMTLSGPLTPGGTFSYLFVKR